MKKTVIITIVSIFLLLITKICFEFYEQTEINDTVKVELVKCVDGDTAYFKYKNKSKSYRFLGINTPELKEKLGDIAANYTCKELKSAKIIELKYDKYGYKQDKYKRELVWVIIDGELLQKKLLENGYAKIKYVYANYDYLEELYLIQEEAIEQRLGIWQNYEEISYNNYYTITLNYNNDSKIIKIIKNEVLKNIINPMKAGCRFLGWNNGNYLFDLSTKIKKDYTLTAKYDCEEDK